MNKSITILMVLLIAAPCIAGNKKSMAKQGNRHAPVETSSRENLNNSRANLNNARANRINMQTRDMHQAAQQQLNQQAYETGKKNADRRRAESAQRSRSIIGW